MTCIGAWVVLRPGIGFVGLLIGVLLFAPGVAQADGSEGEQLSEKAATPGSAEEQRMALARKHFHTGSALLQKSPLPDYRGAYAEILKSYEISGNWKALGNLGLAAMHLERDGEAVEAIREYLLRGGLELPEDERRHFENDLANLNKGVAWLTLHAPGVSSQVVIHDERQQSASDVAQNDYVMKSGELLLGLRAGLHRIVARNETGAEVSLTIRLSPGDRLEREIRFQAEKNDSFPPDFAETRTSEPQPIVGKRPVPIAVYVGAGATLALAAGATVSGVFALKKKDEFDQANDGGDAAHADELRRQVQTMGLMTDIFIGSAVAAAGVTTVLYFTRPAGTKEVVVVRPLLGPGLGGFAVKGTF